MALRVKKLLIVVTKSRNDREADPEQGLGQAGWAQGSVISGAEPGTSNRANLHTGRMH